MSLSKSDRVNIISEVAKRLGNESWQLIDLTLTTYGLPTVNEWSEDRPGYVIQMMLDANEDAVVGMAQHVGIDITNPTAGIDPPFWKDGDLRVFISHLAEHKKVAADLQEAMGDCSLSGFVAHNDIEPTKEWQDEIETALETCDVMVVLLHQGFGDSKWTDQEVGYAMGRHIPILTVSFDADPHGFIGKFQAFNGNGKNPWQIVGELVDALCVNKSMQVRMQELLIRMFEHSFSFQNAKDNMSRLEAIENWRYDYSDRLTKAVSANGQINSAFGVPERLEKLLEKWK